MKFITLENKENYRLIEGIIIYPLKINRDKSGILVETLRKDWLDVYGKDRDFFMQYYSKIPSGVAKDENAWHYHNDQEDRILVVDGEIVLVVADNRVSSSTKGLVNLFHISSEKNPYMLVVPKKTLHGIIAISQEKAIILNFPTALYNSDDNKTVQFKKAKMFFDDGVVFSWKKIRNYFRIKK